MSDKFAPNPQRLGDWIQTYSGIAFYPLDPRPEEILIEDIAHALSLQCRFTGHVRKFYSVAEHSVNVSRVCDPNDALWGLLHDASEAYLCDVSRPIKRLPEMVAYKMAEKNLQSAIATKFGLAPDEPAGVKRADTAMLGREALDLMSPLKHPERWRWCTDVAAPNAITRTWSPEEAEERFLDRFRELTTRADLSIAAKLLSSARKTKRIISGISKELF